MCGKRTKQAVALAVLFVLMFIGGCFFVKANQAKEFEKNDYVAEYRERYGAIDQIMTGVNQESVWSSIDFDSGTSFVIDFLNITEFLALHHMC